MDSSATVDAAARQHARALLDFIDASPSPWHAVATAVEALRAAGYEPLAETDTWTLHPGDRRYVVRDDSTIGIIRVGHRALAETGLRLFGAHTDSPGLRVKPQGAHDQGQTLRLGVEVYGGPILATFADRDLSLAGRVSLRSEDLVPATRLVRFERPLVRVPNAAIHLNRGVNSEGLKLDRHKELPLVLGAAVETLPATGRFRALLADALEVEPGDILSWELNAFDTQPGEFFGIEGEFIANSQLDNLACCHAGLTALLETDVAPWEGTVVCALFDHEEVGSVSAKGADGSFLPDLLERVALASATPAEAMRRALARSVLISADMAHAFHPAYPEYYDDDHAIFLNRGPAVKINASQRYSSEAASEGMFRQLCERAGVPSQVYVHRGNLPCGSTIGPAAAARLGVRTVDVGNPMWSMHSARESAGAGDHTLLIRALRAYFGGP